MKPPRVPLPRPKQSSQPGSLTGGDPLIDAALPSAESRVEVPTGATIEQVASVLEPVATAALSATAPGARVTVRSAFVQACRLLIVVGVVVAGAVAEAAPTPKADSLVEQGQLLYHTQCVSCHDETGDRVPVAPLRSRAFLDSRGDATLVTAIGQGKGTMPAAITTRGGTLSEQQIRAIVAYLNSSAGRISQTLVRYGETVFQQHCANCHGEKGDRVPVVPLTARAFMASRTDADLVQTVAEGKGVMPGFRTPSRNVLSEQQVLAVASFLRYNAEVSLVEQANLGRDLYLKACLACHGERGDRIPGVALASGDFVHRRGESAIAAAISDGKGTMPGFYWSKGGTFEMSDISALLAYLKSWAGYPSGVALAGLPMLGNGRDLYRKNCAGCHGEGGDKLSKVKLKAREYLASRSDLALAQAIRLGNDRGMAAWGAGAGGPLSDGAIQSIIEYLRFLSKGQFEPPGAATPAAAPSTSPAAAPAAPKAPLDGAFGALPAGDPVRGKELFTSNCVGCHGESRDKMPTAKLADGAWLQQRGDAALTQTISNGKGGMPVWSKDKGGSLSAEDIASVLAYLKSAAGVGQNAGSAGQPPPVDPSASDPTVPLVSVNPGVGHDLFVANCVPCHGADGLRIHGAPIGSAAYTSMRLPDGIRVRIAAGRPASGMPAWSKRSGGPLSDSQIQALMSYLPQLAGVRPKSRNRH